MALSVREALARVVDLFGPSASWDPTKLYGNLMVSPNGNILVGTTTDDNTNKFQVAGPVKITGALTTTTRPTFNGNAAWDAGNFVPGSYALLSGASYTGVVQSSVVGTGAGVFRSLGDLGTAWVNWASATAAFNVDAINPAAGYMGIRWTQWGSRHLAAISGYSGGSSGGLASIVFNMPGNSSGHVFYDGGNATFAGALSQNSDYRIKTNVESMDPAEVLRRVLLLQPKEYDRLEHEHHLHGRQVGFIAHEVQEQFPLLVKGTKDAVKTELQVVGDLTPHREGEEPEGYVAPVEREVTVPDLQSVNYIGMVPYLTASIQALNSKLEERDALIAKLVKRVEELEAK